MNTDAHNAQKFKLNLQNIRLLKALQNNQSEIEADVECIKHLSETCYKATSISECSTVIKNAQKILNGSKIDNPLQCQIYLIKIDGFINSVIALEPKLTSTSFVNSDDILIDLKNAVNHIGAVFGTFAQR